MAFNFGAPTNKKNPAAGAFSFGGAGEHCWELEGSIEYINSWDLDVLEVNGVDLKNSWVLGADLPEKLEGKYLVRYSAQLPWAQFEAVDAP